jgi:hypothetical protein
MDIASSSEEDSDSDSDTDSDSESDDGEITSQSGKDEIISETHALPQAANIADDLAPELQPEAALEPVRSPSAAQPS